MKYSLTGPRLPARASDSAWQAESKALAVSESGPPGDRERHGGPGSTQGTQTGALQVALGSLSA